MKKNFIRAYYSEALNEKKKKCLEKLTKVNPWSSNLTKWSNPFKQFVGSLPTNCLSVFGHFVGLVLKGLKILFSKMLVNAYDYWGKCFHSSRLDEENYR